MIYLASTSPRRKFILKKMGVRFRAIRPSYEEGPIPVRASAVPLVRRHALEKARSGAAEVKRGLVLGADTVVAFRGRIFGKPRDMKGAVKMLGSLQGRWHTVYTGVALFEVGARGARRVALFHETTRVKLKEMNVSQIRAYFRRIDPLDKAGAYAIQGAPPTIVQAVKGSYWNAVGLPAERLARRLGGRVPR